MVSARCLAFARSSAPPVAVPPVDAKSERKTTNPMPNRLVCFMVPSSSSQKVSVAGARLVRWARNIGGRGCDQGDHPTKCAELDFSAPPSVSRNVRSKLGWFIPDNRNVKLRSNDYSPPVVVRRMVPRSPTTDPVLASANETAKRAWLVGANWGVQFAPPSVVRRMVPEVPTATPTLALANETPHRASVVPLDWNVHVVPPLVVRRMVPKSPTTVPVLGSTKETPNSERGKLPLGWKVQVVPPSVVRRMVPALPTAVAMFVFA